MLESLEQNAADFKQPVLSTSASAQLLVVLSMCVTATGRAHHPVLLPDGKPCQQAGRSDERSSTKRARHLWSNEGLRGFGLGVQGYVCRA